MVAVFDYRDIDIHNIAVFQFFVGRDAVTNNVVDRRTDRFGKRRMAVIQGRGNGLLLVNNVIVTNRIQLVSSYPFFDVVANHGQYFCRKTSCDTHFLDFFSGFDNCSHPNPLSFGKS